MKKIFLLGVGAQKCGTTWLHSQLEKNVNVNMGFIKEYHVFDAIYSEHCVGFRKRLISSILHKANIDSLGKNSELNPYLTKRLSFIDNTENYFEYFDYIHMSNPDVELVGDITPSYSLLDSKAFEHIKSGLEAKGFVVKVIFLMRDPVERAWSMLRNSRRAMEKKGVVLKRTEEESLRIRYKQSHMDLRTRYEKTIIEVEKVFNEENIFYEIYEDLFNKESFDKLCEFLNVDLISPDFTFKSNASPKVSNISESLVNEISLFYSDTYSAVKEKIPKSENFWLGMKSKK